MTLYGIPTMALVQNSFK